MELACLDLEGVLIPEIWIEFAERTRIDALRATTRDIPDYDVLMKQRLAILKEHGLGLADIQEVIGGMRPLEGAADFLAWLRARFQVIIQYSHYFYAQRDCTNPAELYFCVQPPVTAVPPDGWGSATLDNDRGAPLNLPDYNVLTIGANIWW